MARPAKMNVNSYDAEMAELAKQGAQAESTSLGGAFISTKGGHYFINGAQIPGDKFNSVVVASAFVNAYYTRAYDPQNPETPACYAIGDTEAELAPHEDCSEPQATSCSVCPFNKFGSAGKGKACKNQRKLVLIAESDLEEGPNAQLVALSIPPTSTAAWAGYVQQCANTLKRPPVGVLTEARIFTESNKTYANQAFSLVRQLTKEELAVVFPRREEALTIAKMPFPKVSDEEVAATAKVSAPKTNKFSKPSAKARR